MSILTDAQEIRDETALGANTATRVGGVLVNIAGDLTTKQAAIEANASAAATNAAAIVVNAAATVTNASAAATASSAAATANAAAATNASGITANNNKFLALKITVELDSTLTNFFYAPQSLRIASVTNINGSPTIVIRVNTVVYVFGALIATGALIALTSNVVGVVNLNGTYE